MDVASVALVVAALGVNFGWQPSAEDPQAYEVLMQVEPELVDVHGRRPAGSRSKATCRRASRRFATSASSSAPRNCRGRRSRRKADAKASTGAHRPRPGRITDFEHTANFQSDDGWSGDRYATSGGQHPAIRPARSDDRRRADSHRPERSLDDRQCTAIGHRRGEFAPQFVQLGHPASESADQQMAAENAQQRPESAAATLANNCKK